MKKKYTIYFEVFGKKLKTSVYANNEALAKIELANLLNKELKIHKTKLDVDSAFNELLNQMFK